MQGSIYLIPVTLGSADYRSVIPDHVTELARSLRYFIVEETRSARRFLRLIDRSFPIDESQFFELNEHTKVTGIESFLEPALNGHDMGLMSEAGLPGIADPGMHIVRLAHQKGLRVIPLAGPSSIILALISSGLNGQKFVFHGYLPQKQDERSSRIREIEKRALGGESQIFMETPYRAAKMTDTLLLVCRPETLLCVACDITLETESIKTMRVSDWKKMPPSTDGRLVVFILGS
jgi:16S rRNA (cytidine1402-2'-O)-methyltransferase